MNDRKPTRRMEIGDMILAGVDRHQAVKAFNAVHSSEHQAAGLRRQDRADRLAMKGHGRDAVIAAAARKLAGRLSIGSGRPKLKLVCED